MNVHAEKMELLTANEIDALNLALCQPPPPSSSYSEEEQNNLYRWSSEFSGLDIDTDMLPCIDLLDFALLQDTDNLLQVLLLLPEFNNINLFYYVYIRYTHRSSDYLGSYNVVPKDEYQLGFDRLTNILIEFGKKEKDKDNKVFNHILSWALNGERQTEIYRMRDEHNYFSPNLSFVKKLVPDYFTAKEALECYETFEAYTVSPDYSNNKERVYPYEKDEAILDYLVYCTTLL